MNRTAFGDPRGLADPDHQRAADAFEAGVLTVLGMDEPDLEALVRAHAVLSTSWKAGRGTPMQMDAVTLAVFGIVFGAKSFQMARRILSLAPSVGEVFTDVGCGWGPLAMAAVARGRVDRVHVCDRVPRFESLAKALLEWAGFDGEIVTSRPAVEGGLGAGFMLNEMDDPEREVRRWLRVYEMLLLIEPGTAAGGERIRKIRDAHPDRVTSPCPPLSACPMGSRPSDWCHFTHRFVLGPVGRAVLQRSRTRESWQHTSWVQLGRGCRNSGLRVLSIQDRRRKVRVTTCGEEGLLAVTALGRTRAAHKALATLVPGSRIAVEGERLGDGLRLAEPESLEVIESF